MMRLSCNESIDTSILRVHQPFASGEVECRRNLPHGEPHRSGGRARHSAAPTSLLEQVARPYRPTCRISLFQHWTRPPLIASPITDAPISSIAHNVTQLRRNKCSQMVERDTTPAQRAQTNTKNAGPIREVRARSFMARFPFDRQRNPEMEGGIAGSHRSIAVPWHGVLVIDSPPP